MEKLEQPSEAAIYEAREKEADTERRAEILGLLQMGGGKMYLVPIAEDFVPDRTWKPPINPKKM